MTSVDCARGFERMFLRWTESTRSPMISLSIYRLLHVAQVAIADDAQLADGDILFDNKNVTSSAALRHQTATSNTSRPTSTSAPSDKP